MSTPEPMSLEHIEIRHEQIGHMLGSCSLEPDFVPGLPSEQWGHVDLLLKENAALRARVEELEKLCGDNIEYLCVDCNCVYPVRGNRLLQECPTCGVGMLPSSFNLRRIAALTTKLATTEKERVRFQKYYEGTLGDYNRLKGKVAELEQSLETQRTATYQAVEREHAVKQSLAKVENELVEAKCGEALCGHDHSTQYWELRCNKAETKLAEAEEAAEQLSTLTRENERLREVVTFCHDIAKEGLAFAEVGTGAEVALRHIHRKAQAALKETQEETNHA